MMIKRSGVLSAAYNVVWYIVVLDVDEPFLMQPALLCLFWTALLLLCFQIQSMAAQQFYQADIVYIPLV